MTYEPGQLRAKSRDIVQARKWGFGLITGALGFGVFLSEYQRIRGLSPDLLNYAYLALLSLTGLLVFLWIWATYKELNLLFDWLDPKWYTPPSGLQETLLILCFAIVLIALIFTARNPMAYGLVFTFYTTVQIPALYYMNRQIADALKASRARLTEELSPEDSRARLYGEGIDVLERYFLKRPVITRIVGLLIVSTIALSMAIYWHLCGERWAGLAAYGLYFIAIAGSETVIGYWRIVRDASLRPLETELGEWLRNQKAGERPNSHDGEPTL